MNDEEPQYICLNYCMVDQETGHCLTCGRPPLPLPASAWNFMSPGWPEWRRFLLSEGGKWRPVIVSRP